MNNPEPTELTLEFNGKVPEYFRIWIVNLCLTLITLGIFSAWSKVRKKRYFYSHTVLDGSPFQYLAQPLPILKGRIVAVILFGFYYASSHFFTSLLPIVLVAGLILAPWVMVRSAAFNARYSAYRNMCFSFDGDYRGALVTIYWLGLIPVIAVGTAFQWGGKIALSGVVFAVFGILLPWWLVRLKTFLIGNIRFGGNHGRIDIRGGQLWKIYFRGGLLIIFSGAIAAGLAFALSRALKSPPAVAVAAVMVFFYLGYVLSYAYIQAASSNLAWNNTTLGPMHFASTLRGRDLAWLYFSNAIAIIVSCGLLIPWAVIRTLKYRISHMQVLLRGSLAEFTASDTTAVQATGAEVAEIFDFDLSL